jgi:septum formation protein
MTATALGEVDLILASTSRYRAELLRRLTDGFRQVAPGVDETREHGERPKHLAERLALAKARAVGMRHPGCVVIGSDQVAALGDETLGKPGSIERARQQLLACSGHEVIFYTALALIDADGLAHTATDLTRVRFRELDDAEIARYLARDMPLDCAGSFKVEGLGISLFDSVSSEDPTALIGLPLLALCRLLRTAHIATV